MSTAHEIRAKLDEALPHLNAVARVLYETWAESALLHLDGREVCARRARKLRKRGDLVRWTHNTAKGKGRFLWLKRLKFVAANAELRRDP